MVLPSRRMGSKVAPMTDEDIMEQGVASKRPSYSETPHPSKRRRIDQPESEESSSSSAPATGSSGGTESSASTQEKQAFVESMLVSEIESPPRQVDEQQEEEEEQPSPSQQEDDIDWNKLAQTEPAATDIPIFLAAHARKEAANERFATVLDECHSSLLHCVDALLQTVADVHNMQRDRMEAMEADIKHNLVCNDQARAEMQARLEASANAAQGLFAKLLMRVTDPIQAATARMQETLASSPLLPPPQEDK